MSMAKGSISLNGVPEHTAPFLILMTRSWVIKNATSAMTRQQYSCGDWFGKDTATKKTLPSSVINWVLHKTRILYKIRSDDTASVGRQKLKLFNFCRPTKCVSFDTKFVSFDQILMFRVNSPLKKVPDFFRPWWELSTHCSCQSLTSFRFWQVQNFLPHNSVGVSDGVDVSPGNQSSSLGANFTSTYVVVSNLMFLNTGLSYTHDLKIN
jgi:hypothetical protein